MLGPWQAHCQFTVAACAAIAYELGEHWAAWSAWSRAWLSCQFWRLEGQYTPRSDARARRDTLGVLSGRSLSSMCSGYSGVRRAKSADVLCVVVRRTSLCSAFAMSPAVLG